MQRQKASAGGRAGAAGGCPSAEGQPNKPSTLIIATSARVSNAIVDVRGLATEAAGDLAGREHWRRQLLRHQAVGYAALRAAGEVGL